MSRFFLSPYEKKFKLAVKSICFMECKGEDANQLVSKFDRLNSKCNNFLKSIDELKFFAGNKTPLRRLLENFIFLNFNQADQTRLYTQLEKKYLELEQELEQELESHNFASIKFDIFLLSIIYALLVSGIIVGAYLGVESFINSVSFTFMTLFVQSSSMAIAGPICAAICLIGALYIAYKIYQSLRVCEDSQLREISEFIDLLNPGNDRCIKSRYEFADPLTTDENPVRTPV